MFFGERTIEAREIEQDADYTIDLQESDLRGVRLHGSNLGGIRLNGSDLSGAIFSKVKGLTQRELNGAKNNLRDKAIFKDTYDCETGEALIMAPWLDALGT